MPNYRLKAEGAHFGAQVPKAPAPEAQEADTLSNGRSTDDKAENSKVESEAEAKAKTENPDA